LAGSAVHFPLGAKTLLLGADLAFAECPISHCALTEISAGAAGHARCGLWQM